MAGQTVLRGRNLTKSQTVAARGRGSGRKLTEAEVAALHTQALVWGRHLRALRGRASQSDVARRAGVSVAYVCRLEKGEHLHTSVHRREALEWAARAANLAMRDADQRTDAQTAAMSQSDLLGASDRLAGAVARELGARDAQGLTGLTGVMGMGPGGTANVSGGCGVAVTMNGHDTDYWLHLERLVRRVVREELAATPPPSTK